MKAPRERLGPALGPAYADLGKKFGQQNIDRIRNYK